MANAINKLRILALKNPKEQLGGESFSVGSIAKGIAENLTSRIFEVQINPETISRNFNIKYFSPNEPGNKGEETQFDQVEAEILELKFTLDGTGAVHQNSAVTLDATSQLLNALPDTFSDAYVPAKVAQLKATVYDFYDESHRTPFLSVNYGKMTFFGVMEDLHINYTLFDPLGIPLRAEIELKIKAHSPFEETSALLSLLSPDLTREHTVIAGENILRICHEVYEDQRYYIEIAKANQLINFRGIKPGQILTLPPIDKNNPL